MCVKNEKCFVKNDELCRSGEVDLLEVQEELSHMWPQVRYFCIQNDEFGTHKR